MRKLCWLFLVVLLLVLAAPAQTHRTKPAPHKPAATNAEDVRSSEEEIVDLEKRIAAAIRHRDTVTLETVLGEHFAYVQPGLPEQDRDQFLKAVKSLPGEFEWLGLDQLKIRFYGDTAVVTGVQNSKVRLKDNALVESDTAFVDVFRRSAGSWELEMVQAVLMPAKALDTTAGAAK
jgi:ketosteroid isomerase-like protein